MGITTTGNDRIDTATSEIAIALRDAGNPGQSEAYFYAEAMRLRDEIMAGARELPPVLPPWRPAVNGTGRRPWFVCRGWGTESDSVPTAERYHYSPAGKLVRYATVEAAAAAAHKLNGV